MSRSKEISVKESWYIFTIVLLAVLLVLSLGLFLKSPFRTNIPTYTGLKPLGTMENIFLESGGSNSKALFFYGSLLPNIKVKQDVKVTLKANQNKSVVRGKAYMFDDNNKIYPIKIVTANNWEMADDGYYYCNEFLTPSLTIDFIENVFIPDVDAKLNSSNMYSIIFSVETLPSDCDYKQIWNLE